MSNPERSCAPAAHNAPARPPAAPVPSTARGSRPKRRGQFARGIGQPLAEPSDAIRFGALLRADTPEQRPGSGFGRRRPPARWSGSGNRRQVRQRAPAAVAERRATQADRDGRSARLERRRQQFTHADAAGRLGLFRARAAGQHRRPTAARSPAPPCLRSTAREPKSADRADRSRCCVRLPPPSASRNPSPPSDSGQTSHVQPRATNTSASACAACGAVAEPRNLSGAIRTRRATGLTLAPLRRHAATGQRASSPAREVICTSSAAGHCSSGRRLGTNSHTALCTCWNACCSDRPARTGCARRPPSRTSAARCSARSAARTTGQQPQFLVRQCAAGHLVRMPADPVVAGKFLQRSVATRGK